jgi:hypothetical protein
VAPDVKTRIKCDLQWILHDLLAYPFVANTLNRPNTRICTRDFRDLVGKHEGKGQHGSTTWYDNIKIDLEETGG